MSTRPAGHYHPLHSRRDYRPRSSRGMILRIGPTLRDLTQLCRNVKKDIEDDDRAVEYDADDADGQPGIQLTVGADAEGGWSYQTGDNSYSGGAYGYPYWGVTEIYRDTDCREAAKQILDEIAEAYHQDNS